MIVKAAVLDRQFFAHQQEYEEAALRVLRSGWYILGQECIAFEQEFAQTFGVEHCVALNSGLDALCLAIRALGIGLGDEVIVPANTFIATVLAITNEGATPVFVEPDEYYNLDAACIESAITHKTRAIIVVHLYGQTANMHPIASLAKKHGLYLVEDCAQSHLAAFDGKISGLWGNIACFSFYPAKNLGAFGDSGAAISNNAGFAEKMRMLRNYGSKVRYYNELAGINSRMDEIQAALLRVKLKYLKELNVERIELAERYLTGVKNPLIELPRVREKAEHIWHQFVVRCKSRDALQAYLKENGITTLIHYPVPPHLAVCYKGLGYKQGDFPVTEQYADEVLSLPIYNGMTDAEISYVIDTVNAYKGEK